MATFWFEEFENDEFKCDKFNLSHLNSSFSDFNFPIHFHPFSTFSTQRQVAHAQGGLDAFHILLDTIWTLFFRIIQIAEIGGF